MGTTLITTDKTPENTDFRVISGPCFRRVKAVTESLRPLTTGLTADFKPQVNE